MDLDGAHPGSSRGAKAVTSEHRAVFVNIVIYFHPVILSRETLLKCSICLVLIVIIFSGLLATKLE
jgi:hypothetical protein